MKDLEPQQIESLMNSVIEETSDALLFYKQNSRQQLIDRILFDEHHNVLIPLVLVAEKKL